MSTNPYLSSLSPLASVSHKIILLIQIKCNESINEDSVTCHGEKCHRTYCIPGVQWVTAESNIPLSNNVSIFYEYLDNWIHSILWEVGDEKESIKDGHILRENPNLKRPIHPNITALFTIDRTWTQPKRLSTDWWIKNRRYMYATEYYWAIKKNKTVPLVDMWMDLETAIQSEVRKTNIVY